MKINNLAQLKRALQPGARFRVIQHMKPELIGTVREVNLVQSNAVYLKIANQPNHPMSVCNGGKGSYMPFERASCYVFGETIKIYKSPVKDFLLYELEMMEGAA